MRMFFVLVSLLFLAASAHSLIFSPQQPRAEAVTSASATCALSPGFTLCPNSPKDVQIVNMSMITCSPYYTGGIDFVVHRPIQNLVGFVSGHYVLPGNVTGKYYVADSIDRYVTNLNVPYQLATIYHMVDAGWGMLPSGMYYEEMNMLDEQGTLVVCFTYSFPF